MAARRTRRDILPKTVGWALAGSTVRRSRNRGNSGFLIYDAKIQKIFQNTKFSEGIRGGKHVLFGG
jgi:hypothetical protein